MLLRAQVPHGFQVMSAVCLERDKRARVDHALELRYPSCDDIGELVVSPHPDDRNYVSVPGHRVDLSDSGELG